MQLPHNRDVSLFIWITRGQGVAILDGARRGVGTHNALFVPAHELMALDIGRQGYGQVLVIPFGSALPFPENPYHVRIRDVGAQKELTGLMETLGREQTGNLAHSDEAMAAYALLIATWLRRQLLDSPEEPRVSAAGRLCSAYCARIADDHMTGATMADHAQALGVTPTHLTRVCRQQLGRTAATLLTERQLHAARSLLVDTDVAVQDIARHLGFGSAAYFTRFIQHHTGETPTRLRRHG
ncbi:helix-turn-helix transcriptional regulator [Thalassococcus sp. S3]|uniref:helix-turn-helix transcriptional regulator n=1 Tax=Thalassococcus sp. S3 TaxID=2017482 RepID=UPI001023FCE8|nr:helix-turn-helix transcriptional regulator [Thalassococcus sp. S3]QBF31678.1 AraC family transcriptional regulator [Thalassococcus sp. S3]